MANAMAQRRTGWPREKKDDGRRWKCGWRKVCVGEGRQLAGDSGWRASRIKQLTTALAIGGFSGWPSSDPASLLQLTFLPLSDPSLLPPPPLTKR